MDYELVFWIVALIIGWGIMFWGMRSTPDTSTSMTEDKYIRYHGKEDKKWGR